MFSLELGTLFAAPISFLSHEVSWIRIKMLLIPEKRPEFKLSLCHEFCRRRLSSSVHECSIVANLAAIRPRKCFKQSVGRLLQWKRAYCSQDVGVLQWFKYTRTIRNDARFSCDATITNLYQEIHWNRLSYCKFGNSMDGIRINRWVGLSSERGQIAHRFIKICAHGIPKFTL